MAGLEVGDVLQVGLVRLPVVGGRACAEAVLGLEGLVVLHPVHQVEVAHFVLVGGAGIKCMHYVFITDRADDQYWYMTRLSSIVKGWEYTDC